MDPAQELLVLPLQAPLLQDAVEGVLSSIEEPFIVEHEVPAGVVRVTRVRYVGAGVPAEAQPYPGVVEGLEELRREDAQQPRPRGARLRPRGAAGRRQPLLQAAGPGPGSVP